MKGRGHININVCHMHLVFLLIQPLDCISHFEAHSGFINPVTAKKQNKKNLTPTGLRG